MGKGASYSNGSAEKPCAQFVKFTPEQNRRLHAARKKRGQSVQVFAQLAVMRAVEEVEAEHRKAAAPEEKRRPGGLGIRDRLAELEEREEPVERVERTWTDDERPAAPVVNVNLGQGSSGGNDIATLARGVVEAPSYQRRQMVEAACERLARDARDLDEAKRLAAQLDEEIARLEKKQTPMDRVRARLARARAKAQLKTAEKGELVDKIVGGIFGQGQ